MAALPLSGSGIPGSSGGIFAEAASKGRLSPCLVGATALMRVGLLPRQRDCRADAVALGAWERWHRRETVPERALRKQTLRPSSHSELVEFARSANFRVWELRIYIALRGRRGEGTISGRRCPPRGPPWPSNLLFLILFCGSDGAASLLSPIQRYLPANSK